MKKKIRVLHIKKRLSSDGATNVELNFAKFLHDKVRFDWVVETDKKENDWAYKFENLGGKVYYITKDCGGIKWQIKKFRAYMKLFKATNYKIVHMDTDYLSRVNVLVFAKLARIPKIIVHSHSSRTEASNKLVDNKFSIRILKSLISICATDLIACSKSAADWLYLKKNVKNTLILKNGIDTEKFKFDKRSRKQIRDELGVDNEILLGHVGRFSEVKNHKFLIDIFCEIMKDNSGYKAVLIGVGELENEIKELVKQRGLENRVIFTGQIENVNEYYSAMDMFVFPSLFEGLPLTLVEAQAAGLPCLISDTITKEVILAENVKMLPIDSAEKWVEEIKDIQFTDNRDYGKVVVCENGFDIRQSASSLLDVYMAKKTKRRK